jgi:RNA polymerase sigma factor (sigma-70 family)
MSTTPPSPSVHAGPGASGAPDDEELMMRVREGEIGELGQLFERHHARLYAFCLRMTGSPSLAEDLVQEVFHRMLRYRHTFRGHSTFLPWMYRMARNACADHFRKVGADQPLGEHEENRAAEQAGALERLEETEAISLLHQALLALPLDKREVLVLARFEARRYQEIAELLDCSVGAVKVRVHRAIGELRATYLRLLAAAESGDLAAVENPSR